MMRLLIVVRFLFMLPRHVPLKSAWIALAEFSIAQLWRQLRGLSRSENLEMESERKAATR